MNMRYILKSNKNSKSEVYATFYIRNFISGIKKNKTTILDYTIINSNNNNNKKNYRT